MPEEESFLKPLSVKLEYEGGRAFDFPYGISRKLSRGMEIHCTLVDLSNKNQDFKKIGKDVIIDIDYTPLLVDKLIGRFRSPVFELYNIGNYQYALLKMKK